MLTRRIPFLWLLWSMTMAAGLTGCGDPDDPTLTVMTYNVYLGSDTSPLLSASPGNVPQATAAVARNILASNFPIRVTAIANSIDAHRPHVIGLQEMILIRGQSPSDLATTPGPNAEDIQLDFLALLEDALEKLGLDYKTAAEVLSSDIELPLLTSEGTLEDRRLTFRDVVLVRGDVEVSEVITRNYRATLPLPFGLEGKRGYVALDATIDNTSYRVVNTHLEVGSPAVRKAQAEELVAALQEETLPVILLGDFNSDAEGDAVAKDVYNFLRAQGYEDTWQSRAGRGWTCCQDGDLMNEASALDRRIDYIFIRHLDREVIVRTETVGDQAEDRILPLGLWPSDHAGVVLELSMD